MKFRKAKIRDAKVINKIAAQEIIFPYPVILYATLATFDYLYVLENDAAKIIGFICFFPMPFSTDAFVLQVCLSGKYQSKGLGKNLLKRAYETLRNKYKVTKIWAHTLKERSLKFFKKQKWIPSWSFLNITVLQKSLDHLSLQNRNPLDPQNHLDLRDPGPTE